MSILQNNFTCISTVSFHHKTWTNKQQLMHRLAQKTSVYYVEDTVLPHDYIKQNRHYHPKEKIGKLTIIRPWKLFPFSTRVNFFSKANAFLLANQLKSTVPEDTILWIYEPKSAYLLDYIPHTFSIYDCVDDYGKFPSSRHFFDQEVELARKVDLVTTSTKSLHDKLKKYARNIHLVPNGADLFLNNEPMPKSVTDEIEKINGPKFLFAGAINFKLNMTLIREHARDNPDIQFLFVGTHHRDLPKLPNIHYFPPVSNRSLKALYELCDDCYIPYNNPLAGVNPLKVYEAMSIGKPIYGSVIESLNDIKDCIFNCKEMTPAQALEKATKKHSDYLIDTHKERKLSWQHRLDAILKLIETYYRA